MHEMKQSVKLFLNGIKPGILVASIKHNIADIIQKKEIGLTTLGDDLFHIVNKNYPYVVFDDNKIAIFFQNEKMKKSFNKKTIDDLNIGLALGYPKSATKYYGKRDVTSMDFVGLNFHGIQFATHRDLIDENVRWLNRKYDIPVELQTGIFINEKTESGHYQITPYHLLKERKKKKNIKKSS